MELILKEEEIQLSVSPKFFMGQTEITPTEWKKSLDLMLKVCTEQRCEPNVFCLATHYLNMCLISMSVDIKKNQLERKGVPALPNPWDKINNPSKSESRY